MYHRTINVCIASQDPQLEILLQGVPLVDGFTYQFFRHSEIREHELKGCRVIVLDFESDYSMALEEVLAAKDERAVVIGCFSGDNFSVLAENHHHFDQVWIRPFAEDKVRSSFVQVQRQLKDQEDAALVRSYLDSLIDSLPDLIWFKDARGAHLKVNNSFSKTVNKAKSQIEGRGHYFIWDIELDEYAQGEYICLESEDEVLNKKKTCLFDETVKCGDELRKFKTYKSPIFDGDGGVIGTVGFARDVTDLHNLLIELNILIESFPFAVMTLDREKRIESVNTRFVDNFTIDRAEIMGEKIDDLLDEANILTRSGRWNFEAEEGGFKLRSEGRVLKVREEELLDVFGVPVGYIHLFVDVTLEHQLREEKQKLEQALAEIKQLGGLLPICASCKKIRDDSGYWNQLEEYISAHSDVMFSHGMCPECAEKLYPGLYKRPEGQ